MRGRGCVYFNFYTDRYFISRTRKGNRIILKGFCGASWLILKYAKDLGIDFTIPDENGWAPIHILFRTKCYNHANQFIKLAKEEFDIEFDLKATDVNGKTPEDLAIEKQRTMIERLEIYFGPWDERNGNIDIDQE